MAQFSIYQFRAVLNEVSRVLGSSGTDNRLTGRSVLEEGVLPCRKDHNTQNRQGHALNK